MSYAVGRLFCCSQAPFLLSLIIHVASHNTLQTQGRLIYQQEVPLGGVLADSGIPEFRSDFPRARAHVFVYFRYRNLVCRRQYCLQVMPESNNWAKTSVNLDEFGVAWRSLPFTLMNVNYTVLGWPVHALLCLNMVSRMYYGVSGHAWDTYRSAKVGQKYQPRALGGVSL